MKLLKMCSWRHLRPTGSTHRIRRNLYRDSGILCDSVLLHAHALSVFSCVCWFEVWTCSLARSSSWVWWCWGTVPVWTCWTPLWVTIAGIDKCKDSDSSIYRKGAVFNCSGVVRAQHEQASQEDIDTDLQECGGQKRYSYLVKESGCVLYCFVIQYLVSRSGAGPTRRISYALLTLSPWVFEMLLQLMFRREKSHGTARVTSTQSETDSLCVFLWPGGNFCSSERRPKGQSQWHTQ